MGGQVPMGTPQVTLELSLCLAHLDGFSQEKQAPLAPQVPLGILEVLSLFSTGCLLWLLGLALLLSVREPAASKAAFPHSAFSAASQCPVQLTVCGLLEPVLA